MSADNYSAGEQAGQERRCDKSVCVAPSCWRAAGVVSVGEREAVLCELHRKSFLEVSS